MPMDAELVEEFLDFLLWIRTELSPPAPTSTSLAASAVDGTKKRRRSSQPDEPEQREAKRYVCYPLQTNTRHRAVG